MELKKFIRKINLLDNLWTSLFEDKKILSSTFVSIIEQKIDNKLNDYEIEKIDIEDYVNEKINSLIEKFEKTLPNSRRTNLKQRTNSPQNYDLNFQDIERENPINNFTGTVPIKFCFKENEFNVKHWIDILIILSNFFNEDKSLAFEKALQLSGTKRYYFSKNPEKLRAPLKLSNSDIFIETHLCANKIYKICIDLLVLFGFSEFDFKITVKQ